MIPADADILLAEVVTPWRMSESNRSCEIVTYEETIPKIFKGFAACTLEKYSMIVER